MSTRACYTFKDQQGSFSVYKHHDGDPAGAAEYLQRSKANAWPLPRFEADEFAAAFVQASKEGPGGVRLTAGPHRHGDLAYEYTITKRDKSLWVEFSGFGFSFAGTVEEMAAKWPCPWSKVPA